MSSRPAVLFAAACLLAAAPAVTFAQGTSVPGTAHLIEWDLSSLPDQIDGNPGAMVVDSRGEDSNRLWFITRIGDASGLTTSPQRVYRFDPSWSLYAHNAQWLSWDLRADLIAGGIKKLKPSHDRSFIFARTSTFIQKVDTLHCTTGPNTTCDRYVFSYPDQATPETNPFVMVSDIAVDDSNKVFTTGISPTAPFDAGYVQMLNTSATPTVSTDPTLAGKLVINAKRWPVLSGAGTCVANGDFNLTCNAGIDINPGKQYMVYFTETGTNTIAELNLNVTSPNASHPNIRRWSLTTLGTLTGDTSISDPRSLKIDKKGKIWINTGSGHLVSLDPSTNKMTKHALPDGASNDLFGIAPDDDVIGYTATQTDKVGMLFPHFTPVTVTPTTAAIASVDFPVIVEKEQAHRVSGDAPPTAKIVTSKTSQCNGTCIEATLSDVIYTTNPTAGPSLSPLGITPNKAKAQGTFFYTVGVSTTLLDPTDPTSVIPSVARRIGFIRLPIKEKIHEGRDDDDTDDGHDRGHHPNWHNSEPGDEDADGVEDRYDTNTSRENTSMFDPSSLPGQQGIDYPLTVASSTLALIASVEADPTAMIAVDIYNALGVLQATSGPMLGAALCTLPLPPAGTYTARIRNLGLTPVTDTPTFVIRDSIVPQP